MASLSIDSVHCLISTEVCACLTDRGLLPGGTAGHPSVKLRNSSGAERSKSETRLCKNLQSSDQIPKRLLHDSIVRSPFYLRNTPHTFTRALSFPFHLSKQHVRPLPSAIYFRGLAAPTAAKSTCC